MATEVIMPRMTQTMDDGRVLEWLKSEGDTVSKGDPIAVIETDKAAVEIEAPASGRLGKVVVTAGQAAKVGASIAWIIAEGESVDGIHSSPALGGEVAESQQPDDPEPAALRPGQAKDARSSGPVSPVARRLARELGVNLSRVKGTGPGGRVTRDDVLRASNEQSPVHPPAPPKAEPVVSSPVAEQPPVGSLAAMGTSAEAATIRERSQDGMRRAIAERMALSARRAARVTLFVEVDVTEAETIRRRLVPDFEKEHGFKLSMTHLVARATSKALRSHPNVNGWVADDGTVQLSGDVNLGVAVALEGGLIVPVLRGADKMSIAAIGSRLAELVQRARQRRLSEGEFSGGTFTVTNLGMYGVDGFTPIINPPEIAILAVGRVAERPVVRDGALAIGRTAFLCLSFDHRAVDGADGAAFLQTVKSLLEKPELLLL